MSFDPTTLRSYRLQNIQLEFASLKYVQLQGVYVSLTPGDPTLWTGVLFVRKGPYKPAIFRFSISFPANYPNSLPIITFTADIFHPLLTPLTTYTYTGTTEADSVTATAGREERLPPGAFSLRHGFHEWFKSRSAAAAPTTRSGLQSARPQEPSTPTRTQTAASSGAGDGAGSIAPESQQPLEESEVDQPGIVDVLKFMRSSFEEEKVLDELPFEAAANPSAWYAWRSHREETLGIKLQPFQPVSTADATTAAPGTATETEMPAGTSKAGEADDESPSSARAEAASALAAPAAPGGPKPSQPSQASPSLATERPRHPSQWKWDGVWQERVKRAVNASLNESVLYGGSSRDETHIQFLNPTPEELDSIQADMKKSLGVA